MNSKLRILVASSFIVALLSSCAWLISSTSNRASFAEQFFISGYVVVPVSTSTEQFRDIALPHASVFLFDAQLSPEPLASTLSDLSGRFRLKTEKPGNYIVCVEAEGFSRYCEKPVGLSGSSVRISPLRIPRQRSELGGNATIFGTVVMGDGTNPRGFEPLLDINAYTSIRMESTDGIEYNGFVNNFGEYIIPSVPIDDDFVIHVNIDNESKDLRIQRETALLPNQDHRIDIQLANRIPKVHLLSASFDNRPLQVVAPGSTVTLTAATSDLDNDELVYRWALSDGTTVGPSASPLLDWTLPNRQGIYSANVVVSDERGGYTRNSVTINATGNRVVFSGQVVDAGGLPIGQAQVDINGRLLNTTSNGQFEMQVPVADRYVLNIRKSGSQQANATAYATASFVYTGAVNGGRWVLRRAQVFSADPSGPISLEHKRDDSDCLKPSSKTIDWERHLNTGIFEWQDGRGYPRSIPEIGQTDSRSAQRVMQLFSRIDRNLSALFGRFSGVRTLPEYTRMPCQNGIRVEIPADSLEDPNTGLAPSGLVQITLSTVDLTMPQMPGDFSATDDSGRVLSMESFGAGSIEIRSGNTVLNLKPDATATVTIPVDATQIVGGAALDNEIPFLYYNEQRGIWEQDGIALLNSSGAASVYTKEVTHFSTMNADILKSGQSCLAVELDPGAGFTLPLEVEVTLQPSVVNLDVIQVRKLIVDSQKSNVIYNLPNNSDIVLVPIIQGIKSDGSAGPVPAGVFVVNTGGPQSSTSSPPTQNSDGTYYSESGGVPAGPCASRVTLRQLQLPSPSGDYEFLQGLSFQSTNISEFDSNTEVAIIQGANDYYDQVDPRDKRSSFNDFKSENKFGQPLDAAQGEVEYDAQFANSGDLGFGRDMHCRRNLGTDGQFDIACYVTNYGQPPNNFNDQVDANNALNNINPAATVAMEYSRVENPESDPDEFPDNIRAVKFFVYAGDPDTVPVTNADLDGIGERPIPQLCMVCHGGQLVSQAVDVMNPQGPKFGAFTDRADIMNMNSRFLPFDLNLYTFPAAKSKAAQQAAFKGLNLDIVREVAQNLGVHGTAITELVDAFYDGGSSSQIEEAVISGWDSSDPNSDSFRFYRDVFAPACRTCHVSSPFGAPSFVNKVDFHSQITNIQNRVCAQAVMPHAKRTNELFWTSIDRNMPGFLELYGQILPGWSPAASSQCGQYYESGGNVVLSDFSNIIYPILTSNCSGCHSVIGNAGFAIGGVVDTYNDILNGTYIVPNDPGNSLLYQRIIQSNPGRMPQGGPDLGAEDENGNGVSDADEILNWINAGAPGP